MDTEDTNTLTAQNVEFLNVIHVISDKRGEFAVIVYALGKWNVFILLKQQDHTSPCGGWGV